jgi:hypothetical protein
MENDKSSKISIFILSIAAVSLTISITFVPVLADPFGIFNYDNPTVVIVQGLRAHLFEAHDATHHANSTEIVMHLEMANEEIPQFLQNLTAGQLPDNQNSNVSTTLQNVQMQLDSTISVANTGNMPEVLVNLKQADEQLAALLPSLGYTGNTNSTSAYYGYIQKNI